MTLQAFIVFPGLERILRGTFTLSHGITPSVATIDVVPQQGLSTAVGTLQLTFGGVQMLFPSARINQVSVRSTGQGTVWTLQLYDRRWKWEFGEIYGLYNVRNPKGELDQQREKTPRELATLLLQAMGEPAFDVSQLPNETRPEIDWVAANPARELARLCDSLGCRVVLSLDNTVRVYRVGVGSDLPSQDQMTAGLGLDPPENPDSLKLVTGPTRFQSRFTLEPVGLETAANGSGIKPIQLLSYNPGGVGDTNGWTTQEPTSMQDVEEGEARRLALQTVFRWYRIRQQLGRPQELTPFGFPGTVTRLDELLPIDEVLLETYTDEDEIEHPKPAVVSGEFVESYRRPPSTKSTQFGDIYRGEFRIQGSTGIVEFSQPVTRIVEHRIFPARLVLETSYQITPTQTGQPFRHAFERQLPGPKYGTGPRLVRADEIGKTVRAEYGPYDEQGSAQVVGVVENTEEIQLQAEHLLDAAQSEYTLPTALDIEYAGLIPISPDGAIQQVAWNVGPDGAKTRAGRNREFSIYVPAYTERRRREETSRTAREEARAERAANRRRRRKEPSA